MKQILSVATVAVAVFLFVSNARGQEEDWHKVLEDLCSAYRSSLQQRITLEKVAERVGVVGLEQEQTRTHEEVMLEAKRRLEARVEAEIPAVDAEKVRAEAEEACRLWKVGERIEFTDRRGRKIQGKLTFVSSSSIRVGGKNIGSVDFTPEVMVHIDAAKSQHAIINTIQKIYEENSVKREGLSQKLLPRITNEVYQESGFVRFGNAWYNRQEVTSFLETQRKTLLQEEYDRGIARHLRANGFVQFESEWIPKEMVAEKEKEKAQQREEEARQVEQLRKEKARREEGWDRWARETLAEAQNKASIQIPAVIEGLLRAQARGDVGSMYWSSTALPSQLFAPTDWEIMKVSVDGLSGLAVVRVDSSTRGGFQIRKLWNFYMEYEMGVLGGWKVFIIGEN